MIYVGLARSSTSWVINASLLLDQILLLKHVSGDKSSKIIIKELNWNVLSFFIFIVQSLQVVMVTTELQYYYTHKH